MTKIAPDLEVDLAHLNLAAQDEENRLKEEMQKLLPVVALMRINARPNSLMGLERDQKLSIMGYSRAEIKDMCRPKLIDREQVMANVMAAQKQRLRELAKSWPKKRREQTEVPGPMVEEVEVFISGQDFPDELKEFDARIEAEREMEWRRWLKHGIELGFVEGEGEEAKLSLASPILREAAQSYE